MNTPNRYRHRVTVLFGALAIILVGSLPLIGQAQDATPADSPDESQLIEEGSRIYSNVCIACHQPDGRGIDGIYLPLNGNPLVTLEDPTALITVVLTGRGGMPRFDTAFDDEEVAAITSYVRQEWDNDAGPVSPEQVAEVRASITGTPVAEPTPEGQEPEGPEGTPDATPEEVEGTPEVTPEAEPATPEATP